MIANKLRKIRLKQGLTLRQLDHKSNITATAICDIENGKNTPNLETADKIAKSLSVSIYDVWKLKSTNK